MKKTLLALIACAALALAGAAHADVINFDELAPGGEFASLSELHPYAGLTWSEDWYAGDTSMDGYANAARSGTNFVVNAYGNANMSISRATAYNFDGAWFATPEGAAAKAGWINISAYNALDQLIGTTGDVAISDSYLWVAGGFGNVVRLAITSDGGWYAMDDFNIADAVAVPVPATPLVLAIGLLALGLSRRLPGRAAGRG